MALLLKVKTPTGVSATYHRIANLSHNTEENLFGAVLYSYYNQQLRNKGCSPILAQGIQISYAVAGETEITKIAIGNAGFDIPQRIEIIDFTRTLLYNIIKQLPPWTTSNDHLIDPVVNIPDEIAAEIEEQLNPI